MQRTKLKPFFKETKKFIGRLDLISSSKAPKSNKKQVLIKDIVFAKNHEYVSDHVWVDLNKNFHNYQSGDIIKFKAKVYNYPKSINETIILQYGLKNSFDITPIKEKTKCQGCDAQIIKKDVVFCRETEDNKVIGEEGIMDWCPNNNGNCKTCENFEKEGADYVCAENKNHIAKVSNQDIIKPPKWCPERSENMNVVDKLIEDEIVVDVKTVDGTLYPDLELKQEDTYNYLFESHSGNKKYIHKANIISINF